MNAKNPYAYLFLATDEDFLAVGDSDFLTGSLRNPWKEEERVRMAGVASRVHALETFAPKNWREAIKGLYAVSYGAVSGPVRKLIALAHGVSRRKDAAAVVEAFQLCELKLLNEKKEDFGFGDGVASAALYDITHQNPNPVQVILRVAAEDFGLFAECQKWEFLAERNMPGNRWVRVGQETDIEAVLSDGRAVFTPDALAHLINEWSGLASQGEDVDLPEDTEEMGKEELLAWAEAVQAAAWEKEGSNAPLSSVEDVGTAVRLGWAGTYTKGRFVEILVDFDEQHNVPVDVTVEWSSATGRPSRYLSVERHLALDDCTWYGYREQEGAEEATTA